MTDDSDARPFGLGCTTAASILVAMSLVFVTPAYALDPAKALSQYVSR